MSRLRNPATPTSARFRRRATSLLLLLVAAAGPLAAQDPRPVPPRPDTAAVPPDSAAAAAAADSLQPIARLVGLRAPLEAGWSDGVWVWDQADLLRDLPLTLGELLQRIPGMIPVRSGFYVYPEAVSALGTAGGRVEILLDGYALDPLAAGSPDLARLELGQYRTIRVERRLDRIRIHLESLTPEVNRPYSRIEAGSGDLDTNFFRGLLLTPRFVFGPLGLGIDRLDTDGLRGRESADAFNAWVKWGLLSGDGRRGAQLELRRGSIDRSGDPLQEGSGRHTDWVVRARSEVRPGLTVDTYIGRSKVQDSFGMPDPAVDDSAAAVPEEASTQLGLRGLYERERAWAMAVFRSRGNEHLASVEARLAGGLRLGQTLRLRGEAEWADWRGLGSTAGGTLHGELRPLAGLSLFGELARSSRAGTFLADSVFREALTERRAARAGVELERGGFSLGVAGVSLDVDSVAAFALPFDRATRLFPAGARTGIEATARVPLLWRPLRLEGWYTGWVADPEWLYFPARAGWAALVLHSLPLPSGNLEILTRLEARHRARMLVPAAGTAGAPSTTRLAPPLTTLDFLLHLRILSVRLFLRWENIAHRLDLADVPGRALPGQHVLYGVKWEFSN